MKILVISGFLGAGKTTFIRELARRTGREMAILENEYGSVGVDGDILENSLDKGTVNIWELTEGCICCSMKGDFAASVLTIANTVDPEYLVIEPTGVGMLSNIIENLQQIEYERITLLAPITIVDGNSYHRYILEYPSLYKDQLQTARTILVSKMEHSDGAQRQSLREALYQWAPEADIVTDHYSAMCDDWWNHLLEVGYDGTSLKVEAEENDDLPETFALEGVTLESPEQLIFLMEQLIRGQYGDIIRAKGCLKAGDQVLRYDVADGRYCIIGAEEEKAGKAVFIGKGIKRQRIRRIFFRKTALVRIRGQRRFAAKVQ